ncbi:ABC transporter permease [Phenylobacterium sp. LH3H17]|uniref:ABC transporter permease n=1 Tax=Phenylobacterium sp. LH3H17 TaxID=2903901 RepID=UPI0020CA0D16|nr:ABC transporter permease [Phenylobacterium sp. LH3H17]UTP40440.1 ABC transporter permease [Phenylobacterium sp. LH3H17]
MFWSALRLALSAIRRNIARSMLTVLGVVIGVAAVITMVNVGAGATQAVSDQIASLGSNLLMVRPGQRLGPGGGGGTRAPPFRAADVEAVSRLPGLSAVSGFETTGVVAVFGAENWSTSAVGANRPYFAARKLELASGRIFNEAEEEAGRAVCVLGQTVRKELYRERNPVGTRLRVRQFSCEVIGLLKAKGQAAMGQDQDDVILLPLRTVQRRLTGSQDIGSIAIAVADEASGDRVKSQLAELLRERRRIGRNEDDDFNVLDTRQIAEAATGTTKVMTALLAAVAAVSLVVGGIGIMNVMLVSVTERTREIGVRLAIGALEGDVLLQFLIEAVTLSVIGGLLGLVVAVIATAILAQVMHVPLIFDPLTNLMAFSISATVGVIFGYFPARRAARLDPIDALRHE